eukprot:SAG22_NODE_1216_length_5142_cov_2.131866_3_plen_178_part_00
MPGDQKSARRRMRLLKFLVELMIAIILSLLLVLVFLVLTADPPSAMTASPLFDPPPGVYMANGNPAEDWSVDGAHAVRVISRPDTTQTLPVGVSRVVIYTTTASMPGEHRSGDTIDIFDSDKPCGNPCEQIKLQMTRRAVFYENSVRANGSPLTDSSEPCGDWHLNWHQLLPVPCHL